ncbi:MAG: hypothetical protein Ct9H300mP8_04360 [Gammaproteobacteria bacterium]|nr:MAG: hypothetical protein Ct9H300mP8_04360 [Gammaproteobacteria bacterium]
MDKSSLHKKIGAAAPQLPGTGLSDAPSVRWNEDCLTLNVTTPATPGGGRPVLVWIHGGAYRTGQGGYPGTTGPNLRSTVTSSSSASTTVLARLDSPIYRPLELNSSFPGSTDYSTNC